jgi:hypothetical protein
MLSRVHSQLFARVNGARATGLPSISNDYNNFVRSDKGGFGIDEPSVARWLGPDAEPLRRASAEIAHYCTVLNGLSLFCEIFAPKL